MKNKAIALCRVSSDEQLKNNSLARQNEAVMKMAERLNVKIPQHYVWSGSVSSKRGQNMKRKDLNEMYNVCKRDKTIKYVIVDEPDRFMRSIDEAFAWEAKFRELGVKVMYTDEQLNGDDLYAKLQRFIKYFQAEGSNEERINKAISGHKKALRDGRYTFQPPIGYKKGSVSGIHEVDPDFGPYLRIALVSIAEGTMTIKEAMNWYNETCPRIASGKHCKVTMDKWRKWIMNPYYAGIVEMNKKIKARNENGAHEPLITKVQHEQILDAVSMKKKLHKGPMKFGNPRFPLNRILICEECYRAGKKPCKFTGYDNKNGKTEKIYSRYFCRCCHKALSRDEVHEQVRMLIDRLDFSDEGRTAVEKALRNIWKEEEKALRTILKIDKTNLARMKELETKLVDEIVDASGSASKCSFEKRLEKVVDEISDLEGKIKMREAELEAGREKFLSFALKYIDHMGEHFLELPLEDVEVCKTILFPGGFWMDSKKRIYTPEISPLYRERALKIGVNSPKKSLMVGREGLEPPTFSV